jgi:hypothetical protein
VTASTNSTADARKLERMVTRATEDMAANANGGIGAGCSLDDRPGFGRVVPRLRERPPDKSGLLVHGRPHEGNLRATGPPGGPHPGREAVPGRVRPATISRVTAKRRLP